MALAAPHVIYQATRKVEREAQSEQRTATQTITRELGPLDDTIWQQAASWRLSFGRDIVRSHDWVLAYLETFGYCASSLEEWGTSVAPSLSVLLDAGHEEHAGYTWYLLECTLGRSSRSATDGDGENARSSTWRRSLDTNKKLVWRSPRRLVHIRECLYDRVKSTVDYASLFVNTPFASHGGLPGTTVRLQAWFAKLVECINKQTVPPILVAITLLLLRGPPVTDETAEFAGPEELLVRDPGVEQYD